MLRNNPTNRERKGEYIMFSDLTQFSHFTVIFHRLSFVFFSLFRHNQHKMLNWADFYVCGDIFSLVCWVQKKESHSIDLFGCISVSVSVQPFAAEHDIPFFSLCLCCFLSNFTFSFTQHPLLFLQYSPFAIRAKKTAFEMLHAFNKNRFFFFVKK